MMAMKRFSGSAWGPWGAGGGTTAPGASSLVYTTSGTLTIGVQGAYTYLAQTPSSIGFATNDVMLLIFRGTVHYSAAPSGTVYLQIVCNSSYVETDRDVATGDFKFSLTAASKVTSANRTGKLFGYSGANVYVQTKVDYVIEAYRLLNIPMATTTHG